MTPDISLLFLIGLVSGINACVLGWAVAMGAPRRTTLWFASGSLALAVSTTTPFFVSSGSSPWLAAGFNQLPMLSYACWLVGVLYLCGDRRWIPVLWWGLALVTLPILWWTFVEPQRTIRVTLVAGGLAALRLATAWVLWHAGRQVDRRVSRVFAVVLLVETFTMANRAWSAWGGALPPIGGDETAASVMTWITMLTSALLSMPLLMLLGLGRIIGDLQRSAWRLETTLNALPDGLVELDAERRLRQARVREDAAMPFAGDGPVGASLEAVVPGALRGPIDALLDEVAGGAPSPRVRLRDEAGQGGACFEFSAAAQPVDEDGRPSGYVLLCRDVTASEQAERDLRYRNEVLQHLVSLSPIGLLLTELDSGRIREANPALAAKLGLQPAQLVTLCYQDLFAEQPGYARVLDRLQADGRFGPLELDWKDGRGELLPVRVAALRVLDAQGVPLVWSMVEDISEQQRAHRAKAELVAVVSHELRTPLTSLMGAVSLLAGVSVAQFDDTTRKLLQVALSNGQRLRQLIDDLLDLDRLAADRLRFQLAPQPVRPLLEAALAGNQTYGSDRSVTLALRGPLPDASVEVDGQRLVQVLGNLLSNAIKFSPPGGEVELRAEAREGGVIISVLDRGAGVPETFRDRLWDRFSQADASDQRERGGSGLGLAIAREMIERMGGRIRYEPREGGGACFAVWMPASVQKEGVPGAVASSGVEG